MSQIPLTDDFKSEEQEGQEGQQQLDLADDFDAGFDEPGEDPAPGGDADPGAGDPAAAPSDAPGEEGGQPADPQAAAAAEDTEPPAPGGPGEDPAAELQRKAHGYDSMKGRLEKAQRELAELRRQQVTAPAPDPAPAAPPVPQTRTAAEYGLSPEIQGDLDAIRHDSPELAALILEDSKDGVLLRRRLTEAGRESAEDKAEAILARRAATIALEAARNAPVAAERRATELAHSISIEQEWERLRERHPDFYELRMNPARAADNAVFVGKIDEWISAKPYRDAAPLAAIRANGTPTEIAGLLDQYKQETSGSGGGGAPEKPTAARRDAAIHAVPSRAAPLRDTPPKDDFDAGFELDGK